MSSPDDEPEYTPAELPADASAGYEGTYASEEEPQQYYDPNAYDPNAYDPNAYDPNAYDPNAYDPNAYDPNAYDPNAYDPAAYEASAGEAGYVESEIGYTDSEVGYSSEPEAYAPPTISYVAPPPQLADPNAGIYDDVPSDAASAPRDRRSVPPRRGAAKTRRAVSQPAAGGKARTPYRRPTHSYSDGGSMMSVFLGLLTVGMLGLVAMVMWPRDLADIGGYVIDPIAAASAPAKRNLLDEAQKLMIGRSAEMAISEMEVNTYLAERFKGEQGGLMGSFVSFKRVLVDFSPGKAEVIVLRELFGFPMTMSCKARIDEVRGSFIFTPSGWTIGHINLDSSNIKPVIDLFDRLKSSASEEFETMRNLTGVRFEDDVIVLDAAI
jgi:hypothetical protein